MAQADSVVSWLIQEFSSGVAAALEAMVGTRPGIQAEPTDPLPSDSDTMYWEQPFQPGSVSAFATTSQENALEVGRLVMSAAGVEDCSKDELQSTFTEVLGQAFSLMARSLTTRLQREVTTAPLRSITELPANCAWASLKISEGGKVLSLSIAIPAALAELASNLPSAAAAAASGSSREVTISTVPAARSEESKTFDLLLDVELPVSVSFGRAHVPLKDVLKLTTGSIVELSRAIVEPVDVIVNNCVIAKGEVVVVEGNFGVRIQHVISRSERLRTIQ